MSVWGSGHCNMEDGKKKEQSAVQWRQNAAWKRDADCSVCSSSGTDYSYAGRKVCYVYLSVLDSVCGGVCCFCAAGIEGGWKNYNQMGEPGACPDRCAVVCFE